MIAVFNEAPVEQEMRLSDAFMTKAAECGPISLEVVVKFINVNYEKGAELLTKCKTMQGYSVLIYKIRERQKAHGNLATAIEESIRECESEGMLADYLKEHGGDVMSFLFEKMSREECEAVREADGYDRVIGVLNVEKEKAKPPDMRRASWMLLQS